MPTLSTAQHLFFAASAFGSVAVFLSRAPSSPASWQTLFSHERVLVRGSDDRLARPDGCEAQRKAMIGTATG